MSHGFDYEQDPQAQPGGGAGRGRRRRQEQQERQEEYRQGIPGQYRPADYPEPGYPPPDFPPAEYQAAEYQAPDDYEQAGYEQPGYEQAGYEQPGYDRPGSPHRAPYDAQWEHSGLGWDPRAWREASDGEPRWDDPQHWDERARAGAEQSGWAGFEATRTAADPEVESFERERERYGAGPPLPQAEPFGADPFDGAPFDGAPFDDGPFDPERFEPESFESLEPESFHPQPAPDPDDEPIPTRSASPSASAAFAGDVSAGRGAFGAAGIAVLAGISAIVGKPFLAIVIGLSQVGFAIGWLRTVGAPKRHRTTALVGLTGLAATAIAYRLDSERAPGAIATAVGVGFVLLAADQLLRRDPAPSPGPHRLEALAASATGAALAALPAGFLVAQRQDSKLAAACGLAAAVAVLCSALVGGGTRALGVVAAVAAGAAVGGITAISLNSAAGAKGGAIGGVAAGLLAAVAARVTDRLGGEGADVRISSQTLPLAFAAVGAAIAASVLR